MVIIISSGASAFLGVAGEIRVERCLSCISDPERHWRDPASSEVGLWKAIQPRVYSKYRPAGGGPFRSKGPANKETSGDETLNESGAEALLEVLFGFVSTV